MSFCYLISNAGYDCFEFGIFCGMLLILIGLVLYFFIEYNRQKKFDMSKMGIKEKEFI